MKTKKIKIKTKIKETASVICTKQAIKITDHMQYNKVKKLLKKARLSLIEKFDVSERREGFLKH